MIKGKDVNFKETDQGFLAEWADEFGLYHNMFFKIRGSQTLREAQTNVLRYANDLNNFYWGYFEKGYSINEIMECESWEFNSNK